MFLVVGLGNPGKEYEWTRHNLGFMVIDKLADEERAKVGRCECNSLVGRVELEGAVTMLVKPQTYMNLSGQAVSCLLAKHELNAKPEFKTPGSKLIVISDDLALPVGKIRVRERGSAGGHNGLKSIIADTRTDEFIRLRIGIQPEHPLSDTKKFVLDSFSRSEQKVVEEIVARSAAAIRTIIRDGVRRAMTEFN
jgi:PTH1 family peptidyl-tRNA hydrolase